MNFEENVISKSGKRDFPPDFQLSEQTSSRFIDRFIRLKTTYWNRGYAVVLLGLIGLFITALQLSIFYNFIWFLALKNQVEFSHYDCLSYATYGYYIGVILGGLLVTVYPAHNILGIFVTISSINQLILVMSISYLNTHTQCFVQLLRGATMGVVDTSFNRVWTYWVPLNKQSIRHVPVVLSMLLYDGYYLHDTVDKLHDTNSSYTLTLFIGAIGLAWYVLWLYAINGNYSFWSLNCDFILFGDSNNPRYYSGKSGVSLIRSIVSGIPWKSICTSKPILVVVLLYVCNARLSEINDDDLYNNDDALTMRNYTIILLLLFVFLVELVPEITVSFSTSNVRKFWSCSYFGVMGIFLILEAILGNTLRTNKICYYMNIEMQYLYFFGFYINVFDIAPKYVSLIYGLLLNIHVISNFLWANVIHRVLSSGILTQVESAILMAIIYFAVAVLYAIFSSAETQPWAADEPVEENQQNMVENLKTTKNYNNLP
ncbi:probable vesicular glutamate transporter eat-4 [Metopolophium dirhodum]|uniref:probable vesicular glutamate transporter eat-4 n=1 Tax=Metopolophium dirhodum TaxID=44670 RepID=UPI00298F68C3|nr:probable vesicular glutamate transporter eat-4 [Metopolophium dirhodum]